MAFIKQQTKNKVNYYLLAESYRDIGESGNPRSRMIMWLGVYEEAVVIVKGLQIGEKKRVHYLKRLAVLEGVPMNAVVFGLPDKTYQCIVCDPPWFYKLRNNDPTHHNKIPYAPMHLSEILTLPIDQLSDRSGCVLWLWTTNNHMGEACKCLEAWDYDLKTILTWEKVTKAGNPHLGVGHWLRNCTEHCIVATKGSPSSFMHLKTLTNQSSVLRAPRREHSRKPEAFMQLVEKLMPNTRKLEMFARSRRSGWDSWGNEVGKFKN